MHPIHPIHRRYTPIPLPYYPLSLIPNTLISHTLFLISYPSYPIPYTANGKDFLKGLVTKEQRNSQFDFLRPTHMLFTYFTSLVDSYTLILHPTTELKENLHAHSTPEETGRKMVLEAAVERWEMKRNEGTILMYRCTCVRVFMCPCVCFRLSHSKHFFV